MNDSNKIRKAIINKSLLIFKMIFSNKEDSSINGQHVEGIRFSEASSQDTMPDETHILYIEELLSQGKLGEFIDRVCEDHKHNQVLQDSRKELINLLGELEKSEDEQVNMEPPSVDAQHVRENVYAQHQQDRESTFNNEENPDNSNKPEPQFSLYQCLKTIKQITQNLMDGTERSRFTPKQLLGFIMTVLGTIILAIRLNRK